MLFIDKHSPKKETPRLFICIESDRENLYPWPMVVERFFFHKGNCFCTEIASREGVLMRYDPFFFGVASLSVGALKELHYHHTIR